MNSFYDKAAMAILMVLLAGCGGQIDEPDTAFQAPTEAPESLVAERAPETASKPIRDEAGPRSNEWNEVKSELALLRREVAELRRRLDGGPTASPARAAADAPTETISTAEAQRVETQRIDTQEDGFRRETVDVAWTHGAVARVRAAMAEARQGIEQQLRSVECRSRSCRVEVMAGGAEALEQQLPLIVGQLGQTLPNITVGRIDQGNGQQATVLYLSR